MEYKGRSVRTTVSAGPIACARHAHDGDCITRANSDDRDLGEFVVASSEDVLQLFDARSFDLRERKRTRTRLMIQTEALHLFSEKGYA